MIYEADILAANTYSAQRSWSNALSYISSLTTTYSLSGSELAEHQRYEKIIELLEDAYNDERSIDALTSMEIDTLVSIRDQGFGIATNTATNILMLYDSLQSIKFQLPGSGIQERSSRPVADQQNEGQLIVFPNPANDMIHIKWLNFKEGMVVFRLFNSSGIEVKQMNIDQMHTIVNIGDLPSGLYAYQVIWADNFEKYGTIIIQ